MNRRGKRNPRMKRYTAVFVCLFLLLFSMPAAAAQYGYWIDVDAMKELEASSDFPLQITEKKVVEECLDVDSLIGDADVLAFTVQNNSTEIVTELTVGFVAYNDEQKTCDITSGMKPYIAGSSPEIFTQVKSDIELAPGESIVLSSEVSWSMFSGVRAVVKSYATQGGESAVNPIFNTWQNLAFGLSGDNVTELD